MPESESEPEPRSQAGPNAPGPADGQGAGGSAPWPELAAPRTARERRVAAVVEAFLRDVRAGGTLDPEPYLASAPELRDDLEPLLLAVLRLEASAERLERPSSGRAGPTGGDRDGSEGSGDGGAVSPPG